MYLVLIAWLYVALMMAVAEATASNGTVLGAIFTFLLYGLGPAGLVFYLLGTPARRRARRQREIAGQEAPQPPPSGGEPDRRSHAAGDAVAPEREEP